jgi:hypothetical protein
MKTMKSSLAAMTSALALMVGIEAADASLLTISGGSAFTTWVDNDVLGGGWSLLNNAGLSATSGATLSYYFLGSHSGFINTLNTAGGKSNTEGPNSTVAFPGTPLFSEVAPASGNLFWFSTSGNGTITPGVASGDNGNGGIAFAYLDSSGKRSTTPTDRVLFALDDGAAVDDDHDDYVGYVLASSVVTAPSVVTASSVVPIPAAAWLFGSAILGLAGVGRRKLMGTQA